MTENNRFILCNKTTDSNVWDTLEKQCYGWEYVVSLLNGFDGTIKDLSDDYEQLLKENKKLQGKYNKQLWIYNGLGCEYDSLKKENEELKSTINEVIELLSDEVDLFSDEATEHDINAYMELKELDNKDAFYMATATKKAIRMLKELKE